MDKVACAIGASHARVHTRSRVPHCFLPTLQILCHGRGTPGGCTACPDPLQWPQMKFVVKRVPSDVADRSGVRRMIASIPAHPRE